MRERKRRGKGRGREGDFCPERAGGRLVAKSILEAQTKPKEKVLSSAIPESVAGHRCDEFGRPADRGESARSECAKST